MTFLFYIYVDFDSYSNIAIGASRMLGFHLNRNFHTPYLAVSIQDFWSRWHISLSSWFKDYVYIPLGGSRNGKKILVRNLLIVWALTGIWHGASWNFVIWGIMFGVILIIEKLFIGKYLEKMPTIFRRLYVLFIVMISFIIFNASNMNEAIHNILGLFGINGENFINDYTIYYLKNYFIIILGAIIGCTPILKVTIENLRKKSILNRVLNIIEPVFIVLLLLIVTSYSIDNSYNPFLYFRF